MAGLAYTSLNVQNRSKLVLVVRRLCPFVTSNCAQSTVHHELLQEKYHGARSIFKWACLGSQFAHSIILLFSYLPQCGKLLQIPVVFADFPLIFLNINLFWLVAFLAIGVTCTSAQVWSDVSGPSLTIRLVRATAVPNQEQTLSVAFNGVRATNTERKELDRRYSNISTS